MKKLFFLFILSFAVIMAYGQSTRIMESNLTLKKASPTFYLQGSGAILNFNNDLLFTQSANRLTFSGGNFDLGSNTLFMSGGQIGVVLGRVSSIFATNIDVSLLQSNVGTSVIGQTGSRFLKGWFTDIEITNIPTISGVAMPVANWNTAYTDRLKWDGGSGGGVLVAATGRTSLGGTTVGQAFFTLTNPGAITFPQINDNNTVTALSAANFKTALSLTSSDVGLGNVTNESKATMFTSPAFTGSVPTSGGIPLGRTTSITGTFTAGVLSDITLTGVTTKPYNIMIQTTAGKDITSAVSDSLGISGGTYHLYVYSVDLITDAEIKVTH